MLDNIIIARISEALNLPKSSIINTIKLFEEGATIPFISRYRKEMTGSLDEVQIADIEKQKDYFENLIKRKEYILKTIEEQGKLSEALQKIIVDCYDITVLEDLFLPYKPKRQTKATKAKEKGLEPLAAAIYEQKNQHPTVLAEAYINEQVLTIEDALQGARDIIAEWISEDISVREQLRLLFERKALITSRVLRGKDDEGKNFKDYFDFSESISKCPPHRIHALLRGDKDGFLIVKIEPEEVLALELIDGIILKNNQGKSTDQVADAIADSYKRLLQPSLEYEFRKKLKEKADESAIEVFADNARKLFLSPPLGNKNVIGIDPGFRTGCKIVVLDQQGELLHNTTIYPHPPQSDSTGAKHLLQSLATQYNINAIAIGNGTAGRETEELVTSIAFKENIDIFLISESGASIYSASEIAREEFPNHDVTVRGAVSIARRLLDPLAELVKIDPKSVGVGQYQHDVDQTKLKESLTRVVESCVNAVGINLNTASKHLLTYVSGLGPTLAQNIIDYRKTKGTFSSRKELLDVPRMGAKAFEQCAGFLRIRDAKNPLDNTGVHPERYELINSIAKDYQTDIPSLIGKKELRNSLQLSKYVSNEVGLPTLQDIIKELDKPGLDPRGEAKTFSFSTSVKTVNDLYEGMILPGIVTNVTNFGAFVNIGIKNEGLVHISQVANKFIKHPNEVLSVQDEVQVKVIQIDHERGRVQLSIKDAQ